MQKQSSESLRTVPTRNPESFQKRRSGDLWILIVLRNPFFSSANDFRVTLLSSKNLLVHIHHSFLFNESSLSASKQHQHSSAILSIIHFLNIFWGGMFFWQPPGIYNPPYKILFFDSRPRQTRYGLLGSSTPEPLFVSDPTPPLHFTPKQESVCLFLY